MEHRKRKVKKKIKNGANSLDIDWFKLVVNPYLKTARVPSYPFTLPGRKSCF